ncbi:hypothetical protein HDU91_002657, partial [Kappamyces sp. JEL0680]
MAEAAAAYRKKMDIYLKEHSSFKSHLQGLKIQEKRNESNAKLPSIDPIDVFTRKYGVILAVSTDGEKFAVHE